MSNIKKDLFINEFKETGLELTTNQVSYWKSQVNNNLKFGLELESEFKRGANYQTTSQISQILKDALIPTSSNGKFGDYGVHSVIGDGSLANGLELPLVGKRLEFWSNIDQLNTITKLMKDNGAYLHQRAGTHNHMLLSYQNTSNEMEKAMPGIIFRNFVQLFRRFAVELVWITSTNKGPNNQITRMENFRRHSGLMRFTPARDNRTTEELVDLLNNESYGFLRTEMMKVNGENIERFHMELRFPDCTLNPSQIVAMQVFYKAMLLKAIEFSKYGVINASGSVERFEEQKTLLRALCNQGNERMSTGTTNENLEIIKDRAENMVLYFMNNIKQVDETALEVLEKLAEKPISIRRQEKDNLNAIEKQLLPKDNRDKSHFQEIAKVIDSMAIIGCETKKEWEEELANVLGISYKVANNKVWKFSQVRKIDFDKKLGTVMFV